MKKKIGRSFIALIFSISLVSFNLAQASEHGAGNGSDGLDLQGGGQANCNDCDDLSPKGVWNKINQIWWSEQTRPAQIDDLVGPNGDGFSGAALCSDGKATFFLPIVLGVVSQSAGPFSSRLAVFANYFMVGGRNVENHVGIGDGPDYCQLPQTSEKAQSDLIHIWAQLDASNMHEFMKALEKHDNLSLVFTRKQTASEFDINYESSSWQGGSNFQFSDAQLGIRIPSTKGKLVFSVYRKASISDAVSGASCKFKAMCLL